MDYGNNENVIATFEKKLGSDITRLVLTNYRVTLESTGSWFKKVKGMQNVTLKSINSVNLIVKHNPSFLWLCIIGIIFIVIALSEKYAISPSFETSIGGVVLFIIGMFLYIRSKQSGIEIKATCGTLSVKAPSKKGDGYDFVSKVMQELSSNKS